jgi:hypothetical protein
MMTTLTSSNDVKRETSVPELISPDQPVIKPMESELEMKTNETIKQEINVSTPLTSSSIQYQLGSIVTPALQTSYQTPPTSFVAPPFVSNYVYSGVTPGAGAGAGPGAQNFSMLPLSFPYQQFVPTQFPSPIEMKTSNEIQQQTIQSMQSIQSIQSIPSVPSFPAYPPFPSFPSQPMLQYVPMYPNFVPLDIEQQRVATVLKSMDTSQLQQTTISPQKTTKKLKQKEKVLPVSAPARSISAPVVTIATIATKQEHEVEAVEITTPLPIIEVPTQMTTLTTSATSSINQSTISSSIESIEIRVPSINNSISTEAGTLTLIKQEASSNAAFMPLTAAQHAAIREQNESIRKSNRIQSKTKVNAARAVEAARQAANAGTGSYTGTQTKSSRVKIDHSSTLLAAAEANSSATSLTSLSDQATAQITRATRKSTHDRHNKMVNTIQIQLSMFFSFHTCIQFCLYFCLCSH